jgi:hypothetical protein
VKGGKTNGNPTGPLGQLDVLIPTGPTLWHSGSAPGHALHAVSYVQGQDQAWRQDVTSLREGCCGSPRTIPVNNPPPTILEEVLCAAV